MGKKLFIVVEGHTDKDFIKLYAKHLGLELDEKDVQITGKEGKEGGKYNLSNVEGLKQAIVDKRVLIIFDADNNYKKSLHDIYIQLDKLGVDKAKYEIFLMPNNKDTGNLEILLEKIAKEKCILKCFDRYVSCIENVMQKNKNIKTPAKKSKVFAYLSSFGFKNGIEKFQLNEDIFDLNHSDLTSLKNFLKAHDENVS